VAISSAAQTALFEGTESMIRNAVIKRIAALVSLVVLAVVSQAQIPASNSSSQATGQDELFQRLCEMNGNWSSRTPDFNVVSEAGSSDDDVALIQMHLKLVIDELEKADVDHLTSPQLEQRRANIVALQAYMVDGKFPQNVFVPGRRPVFIDPWGTHCAVGHLIAVSGQPELAKAINKTHQLDVLRDIQTDGLTKWQVASGLTLDELALIQPHYEFRKAPSDTLNYPKEIEDLIRGDAKAVVKAIESGDLSVEARCGGKTLLHFAAAAGDLELVQLLIKKGADINAMSELGCDKTEIAKGGKHSIFSVQWDSSTLVTKGNARGPSGRVYQSARGAFVADVLQDVFGGIAGKNALDYATAKPGTRPRGSYSYYYANASTIGVGLYGQQIPQNDPFALLTEGRAAVAKWLNEQGLKKASVEEHSECEDCVSPS